MRLRFYEPLSWDFAVILGTLAFMGVSAWILCPIGLVLALVAAHHDDILEP